MLRNVVIFVGTAIVCLLLCGCWYTSIQNDKIYHQEMVQCWEQAIKSANADGIVKFNGEYYTIERAKQEQRLHAQKVK